MGRHLHVTLAGMLALFLAFGCLLAVPVPAAAQTSAQAASGPPVTVTVFLSSRRDLCYEQGYPAAIRRFVTLEQERINARGGIGGRILDVRFLDSERDRQKSVDNVEAALADPQTIAFIGLSSSSRSRPVFRKLGDKIAASKIPFISNISLDGMIGKFPNVFTMRASQELERLPVLDRFLEGKGFKRPAFVGIKDTPYSDSLAEWLRERYGAGLVLDRRLTLETDQQTQQTALVADEVRQMIADLEVAEPDVVFLTIGSRRTADVVNQMIEAGVTPALFTGRVERFLPHIKPAAGTSGNGVYPNDIHQLSWDALPDLFNDRLRRRMSQGATQDWLFEGHVVPDAPGWKTGKCEAREEESGDPKFSYGNMLAIGRGTQFADMLSLIAHSARDLQPSTDIAAVRATLLSRLQRDYRSGRGTFAGSFENWSFRENRAAVRTPFVVTVPRDLGRPQLSPTQYVRLKDGGLREIQTLYLDVDLTRAYRIDDNAKTFLAEFYLSVRADGQTVPASASAGAGVPGVPQASRLMEMIDFTNAYIDPGTGRRQLSVEALHEGGRSDAYPDEMRVYKVVGRFLFEPELARFPFDTQRFSIDLQPRRGDAPFIIQPPPEDLRDQQVETDGWIPRLQYVGYDEDFVPIIDARTHEPSIVPFYKASFVWMMKRQTTDYFLRVVVPLAFILIVAYLSIFIPYTHFEAVVTIQVTALLSAVALYLSLPNVDSDVATVSDRMFVFDYMMVSFMIVISILRVNRVVAGRPWLRAALGFVHVVLVPLLVVLVGVVIYNDGLPAGWDLAALRENLLR